MDIDQFFVGIIIAFTRVASFLFMISFLRGKYIPLIAKISVALGISLVAAQQMTEVPILTMSDLITTIIIQFLIGVSLAFCMEMMFSVAKMAGSVVDMDMGLSASQVVDPGSGHRTTVIANFFNIIFVIVFISLGGLNQLILGITYSFKFTTVEFFMNKAEFIDMIIVIFSYMMTATLQIALPLTASMFIVNFILLILGKAAPQMNIFMNMFAIKIALGFVFIYITIPFLAEVFTQMNEVMMEKYYGMLEIIFTK